MKHPVLRLSQRVVLVLLLTGGLGACQPKAPSIEGKRHRVICHGNAQTWADCEARATRTCEEGFIELSRHQRPGSQLTLGIAIPAWERVLVFACR